MSTDDHCDRQCPLCMESLELDDLNFFPCKCEYQICWFCWHRIRTDENGLCPACRQPYPEEPANFQAVSSADILRSKNEKRLKAQQGKSKKMSAEAKRHLSAYRVLQKNLLYVVGLPARFMDLEQAKKNEFFGRYGKVVKLATSLGVNGNLNACSAYITYLRDEDALRAIQAVHNSVVEGKTLKASLGTTKYCASFLRNVNCQKVDCMYLHEIAEMEVSFTKEDMHAGKHAEYEKRLLDEYARLSKLQPSQSSAPTVSNAPSSTPTDHNSSINEATILTEDAYPSICSQIKPSRPTPTPPSIRTMETESLCEHAGRDQESVRNEHDQEVANILADPLSDSASTNSSSPDENEPAINGHPAKEYNTDAGSPVKRGESMCSNALESSVHDFLQETQPEPSVTDEATPVNAESASVNVENDQRISSDSPAAYAPPPGFVHQTSPLGSSVRTATDEFCEIAEDPLRPPGLSRQTTASSILSLLNKKTTENKEHRPRQEPPIQHTHVPTTDWQTAFGLRSSGKTNDDDLGFDPFHESAKALADLVAQESNREKTIDYRQAMEAKLERHHQRPSQKLVAPPPGFDRSNETSQKWIENDSRISQHQTQSRPATQPQRPYPENSLLADIFSSVNNGNHGRPPHEQRQAERGHHHNRTSNSGFFDESYQRYSQPQRQSVSTSQLHQNHRERHNAYPDEATEYRRRHQEQLLRQQESMHYLNEDRIRYQNHMNNSEFSQSRGHQRAVPPPGFAETRSSLWNGSQSHSIMPGYRDLLGNGDKMSRFEKNDFLKMSDSQAGLRALLPNVNVRFVETADENPALGQYHNVSDRHERTPLYRQQHPPSLMHPFPCSTQSGFGRTSPKMGNSANANSFGHDAGQQSSQWMPPPPGFPPIPRQ